MVLVLSGDSIYAVDSALKKSELLANKVHLVYMQISDFAIN